MDEPLEHEAAKTLIREILAKKNNVAIRERYSDHAAVRTNERDISSLECLATLKCGNVVGRRLEKGTWRYRVESATSEVVVAFRSETEFVIVSAWGKDE